MAAAQSKGAQDAEQEQARLTRARLLKVIRFSVLQSVAQHVITIQSEPMLMDEICKGDRIESARLLSSASGLVGVLSIFLNQIGGKLSDSVGRKPGLLLGPLGNMALGALVYNNPTNKLAVFLGRVLRMTITTFSNTVIINAVMADSFSGKDLAVLASQIAAIVGLAVSLVPFVEGSILARTGSPRLTFLILSLLGALQAMYTSVAMPETLEASKRAPMSKALQLSTLNPLGFLKLYTKGSPALRKNVTITSFQGFIEGKNLSDFALVFMKENMFWGVTEIRNWLSMYGITNIVSGMTLTPYLLKKLSVRAYTSLTNVTNIVAYIIRAFVGGRNRLYYATVPLLLPGVNGMSSNALKAVATEQATKEGFGKGEFSAYSNNLRAIVSALAPVILGNWYAWSQKKGFGGSTYWLVCLLAGIIPELLFRNMSDDELKVVPY